MIYILGFVVKRQAGKKIFKTLCAGLLSLALVSSAALPAFAQVPDDQRERDLYLDLVNDFYEEIMTMDAVHESKDLRQAAIAEMKSALGKMNSPNSFHFAQKSSWSDAWPPEKSGSGRKGGGKFENITFPEPIDPTAAHSLKNLRSYVEARLGTRASDLIAKGEVQTVVLGGAEASIESFFQVSPEQIHKLPSLYDQWGIRRYLVTAMSSRQKPRLVYVVPPAKEYLEHYQWMIRQLSGKEALVLRSVQDFEEWKRELNEVTGRLAKRLGGKFDYVALGYYNQWPQVLQNEFEILESKDASEKSGYFARYLKVRSRESGQTMRILTLGSSKTIWGEASAHLLEGTLPFQPKGVFFLGSAGSISAKSNVYDISAPVRFRTSKGTVAIENLTQVAQAQYKMEGVIARFNAQHGNTPSPASQSVKYLENHVGQGTDTLDVEQSLVAETIADFNRLTGLKVQFGAVNVITDKPLGHSDFDLDQVNHEKKGLARTSAVKLALTAMSIDNAKPVICRRAQR